MAEAKLCKDPVCRRELLPSLAAYLEVYQGETFYFCDSLCHEKFMKDPQLYFREEEQQAA